MWKKLIMCKDLEYTKVGSSIGTRNCNTRKTTTTYLILRPLNRKTGNRKSTKEDDAVAEDNSVQKICSHDIANEVFSNYIMFLFVFLSIQLTFEIKFEYFLQNNHISALCAIPKALTRVHMIHFTEQYLTVMESPRYNYYTRECD